MFQHVFYKGHLPKNHNIFIISKNIGNNSLKSRQYKNFSNFPKEKKSGFYKSGSYIAFSGYVSLAHFKQEGFFYLFI